MLSGAADSLFATIFPSACRLCAAPLVKISRIPVCEPCVVGMRALDAPVCVACGQPLPNIRPSAGDELRCGECLRSAPPFTRAASYGSYEAGLRELIHLLKYEHVRPAAGVLGRMVGEVASAFAGDFGAVPPIVIPVPLHASKLRQRGFNQSELIARAALKQLPVHVPFNTSALVRRRATESQTGLTRPQRRLNMRGAFEVSRAGEISGRDILLIDDVFTTGTTVSECARVLRRAGAGRVWVVTVARVLTPETVYALPDFASGADADTDNAAAARLSRAAHA